MTITLGEEVYDRLHRRIEKKNINGDIESLVRPHILVSSLDYGYKTMAANEEREKDAKEWCKALAGDMTNEAK